MFYDILNLDFEVSYEYENNISEEVEIPKTKYSAIISNDPIFIKVKSNYYDYVIIEEHNGEIYHYNLKKSISYHNKSKIDKENVLKTYGLQRDRDLDLGINFKNIKKKSNKYILEGNLTDLLDFDGELVKIYNPVKIHIDPFMERKLILEFSFEDDSLLINSKIINEADED